ncbi:hypothetical protein BsWGS_24741 [Bradybaena similaris]
MFTSSDEMRAWKSLTMAVIVIIILHYSSTQQYVRMCYYHSDSRNRSAGFGLTVDMIDFSLCTHYIYAYGHIDEKSMVLAAWEPAVEDGSGGYFIKFNQAKHLFPSVKTLLSIGGSLEAHRGFLALTEESLATFVTSALIFLRRRAFDGLDIDWYLPSGYRKSGRLHRILQVLRQAFVKDTETPRLLLTLSVSGLKEEIDLGFAPADLARYIDYALIKCYNLYLPLMNYTHFSSPLYQMASPQTNAHSTLNLNFTIRYWNYLGMPLEKIVVGLTGLGRILELQSASNDSPGALITNNILRGPNYGIASGVTYSEVCILRERSQMHFDDTQKCPYLVDKLTWVGYENQKSIQEKLDWMKNFYVAGVMFAGLHEDDFSGLFCEEGKYPLLNVIKKNTDYTTAATPRTSTVMMSQPQDEKLSVNRSVIITIICFFFFGVAIGLAFLVLSQEAA